MSESINPYNCSRPGNLFVAHEQMRGRMIKGLKNAGKSYAVLRAGDAARPPCC
jgi:hypothetical protein